MKDLKTPVVFILFNRPHTTSRVFDEIRRARPEKLLIIADGARKDYPEDIRLCNEARLIVEQIDWPCDVKRLYSDHNLGCRNRVISGLNWVFQEVEEAIILEDDCLPHQSFFLFCSEMLERYRNETGVMAVSGNNFLFKKISYSTSYHFTHLLHIWGWATWRRAWELYDPDMHLWPDAKEQKLLNRVFSDDGLRRYFNRIFEYTYRGIINTWDYQFQFSCLVNGGLSIIPSVNFVKNIGFGPEATITKEHHPIADLPRDEMFFPLVHPQIVSADHVAEAITAKNVYFSPILPLSVALVVEKFKRVLGLK